MTPLPFVLAPAVRRRRAASLSQALGWQFARLRPMWRALVERPAGSPTAEAGQSAL